MARWSACMLALLQAAHTARGLVIPITSDDIDRLRLAGAPELDIVHSLPIQALSPSFHPATQTKEKHTAHAILYLPTDEDAEAFRVPAYQQSHLLDLEVSRSRSLQRMLDRYLFSGLSQPRPRKARAMTPNMQVPPHGWLRNVLERITGSGSVDKSDIAELEYQEYVTRLQNPMRSGWVPQK